MSVSFSELGIQASLQQSLKALHITIPTEIQEKAIPEILNTTNDVVGVAQTGTGKTVAFGMPIIQLVDVDNTGIQAIILAPTRELGQQIFNNLISYTTTLQEVKIVSICGGTPIKPQIERLTQTTHIVVATPGRFVDLTPSGVINLKETRCLVLD
ncbi:MAG: DEAD/DEAH box helicase [Flavobacteriaceae bacterium]|nr:DEAD/DEAH box helicase [Flavobacteriaceae bacterium]